MKWGPTSANSSPARILFLRTPQAKARLLPALAPGNVEKTRTAPVTAVIAYDLQFYEKLLDCSHTTQPCAKPSSTPRNLIEVDGPAHSSLQGAYFIIAARAVGLDCGPMSGFDNVKVDEEFFAAGKCGGCDEEFLPEGHVRSNFLCKSRLRRLRKALSRSPRLKFDEACMLL